MSPARVTAGTFVALILIVTFLFTLPASSAKPEGISFVDALFVATSAVCVTGLSPIDISSDFSGFGQFLILASMQLGGLGLMTFTTIFYAALGRRLPILNNILIQSTFHHSPTHQVKHLLRYIATFTLINEAIGALLLFVYWTFTGKFETTWETAKHSLFLSVSAFTNGGFTLFSDSLVGFQEDFFVMIVIGILIFMGGIGFLVAFDITAFARRKIRGLQHRNFGLSVQTKLTLVASAVLIVIGTAVLFLYERTGALANLEHGEGLLNAFFLTMTTRTAGFNSLDMQSLHGSSILLLVVLMFIGAGAGSTGGGIKIGTVALIFAYMIARLRGKQSLHLWSRTIPKASIDKAIAVAAIFGLLAVVNTLLLMYSETYRLEGLESHAKFLPILFESVSALCTVGISMDFTAELSSIGKIIVAISMFVGRLSPLGLAFAITSREKKEHFRYSEENIIIG
ncbi:MAG: potassium transporter TrkG [Pyrinomonadaceae bacterium]